MSKKAVTMVTFLNVAEGTRMSIVYSEIDENGKVIESNVRDNRVLVDESMLEHYRILKDHAQKLIDTED